MRDGLFIAFGILTILGGLGVVVARHAIFSAFSMVIAFFGLSALYVLWGSNFIAMLQILIYTGAIVVLFVFVVMLLDLKKESSLDTGSGLAVMLSGATVWFFSLLILRAMNRGSYFASEKVLVSQDMRVISHLLFTKYLWPFEILSLFLLALIIGVCVLARPDSKEGPHK